MIRNAVRSRARRWCALLLLVACGACGGSVDHLDGAVGDLPIFAPATLVDQSSAFTSDDFGDPTKFSSYTWHLETDASAAEVERFYAAAWPDAGRVEDEEANTVTLRHPPLPDDESTPLGESVSVTIHRTRQGGRTRFSLDEDVFRARRRR